MNKLDIPLNVPAFAEVVKERVFREYMESPHVTPTMLVKVPEIRKELERSFPNKAPHAIVRQWAEEEKWAVRRTGGRLAAMAKAITDAGHKDINDVPLMLAAQIKTIAEMQKTMLGMKEHGMNPSNLKVMLDNIERIETLDRRLKLRLGLDPRHFGK